ncbi:MAG: GlyGly-CTERM sorting domain-containing protein [Myxococcales bacterium]|nr:GlyGly-CTERM sorting domain-containing protein [Myxococcales bacterium]
MVRPLVANTETTPAGPVGPAVPSNPQEGASASRLGCSAMEAPSVPWWAMLLLLGLFVRRRV